MYQPEQRADQQSATGAVGADDPDKFASGVRSAPLTMLARDVLARDSSIERRPLRRPSGVRSVRVH